MDAATPEKGVIIGPKLDPYPALQAAYELNFLFLPAQKRRGKPGWGTLMKMDLISPGIYTYGFMILGDILK